MGNEVKFGDYVKVKITKATSGTLFGNFISIENVYEKELSTNYS